MKTLGEFYKEKILSRDDLYTRNLPPNRGKCEIQNDLFGWKLYSGKEYIECESEEEARYLKVFLESGMEEVKVPKDEEYLKEILLDLERKKRKIDEIVNSYLKTIYDANLRNKIRNEVFEELIKY